MSYSSSLCSVWIEVLKAPLLLSPQGAEPVVESGSQRRRACRHHGPGPQCSHQDTGLQLLSGNSRYRSRARQLLSHTAQGTENQSICWSVHKNRLMAVCVFLEYGCLCSFQDRDTQKIQWIDRFIEELRTNDKWVIPALKQIREICSLFGEAPQNLRWGDGQSSTTGLEEGHSWTC